MTEANPPSLSTVTGCELGASRHWKHVCAQTDGDACSLGAYLPRGVAAERRFRALSFKDQLHLNKRLPSSPQLSTFTGVLTTQFLWVITLGSLPVPLLLSSNFYFISKDWKMEGAA